MSRDDGARVAVVGAGAAGLMASIAAAEAGAPVTLLERTVDGGRKILISGGGRCNVLPSALSPAQFQTASSPNTLKKMLLSWPLREQRRYFEEVLGIPLALEEESGKLFPVSNRARDVRDGLVERALHLGVELRFASPVEDFGRKEDGTWRIATPEAEIGASALVIATGGLSVPKTGSDGLGLRVIERLGHTVNPIYPALTPLTSTPAQHAELAGVSLHARLHAPPPGGPFEATGGFLFTHRGYSGPAVLDISHLAARAPGRTEQPILVEWGHEPGAWEVRIAERSAGRLLTLLRRHLPERLARRLLKESGVGEERILSQLRRDERDRLMELLTRYPLPWTGDEGYMKAEVTGGGVALGEIDPVTLESRVHDRLFLCGELLDAFGPIGGYNFAWAWATGRAAGRGAAAALAGMRA